MGIYNFQDQFVPDIEADRKRHTIRAKRKYPDKPGSICHLYVGLRRKGARLLKRRRCVKVQEIQIKGFFHRYAGFTGGVFIDGQQILMDECESLARSDGFQSFELMMQFWRTENKLSSTNPFCGDLIHWESDEHWARGELEQSLDPQQSKL